MNVLLAWLLPQLKPVFHGFSNPRNNYLEFTVESTDFDFYFGVGFSKLVPPSEEDERDFSGYTFTPTFYIGESDFYCTWYQYEYIEVATDWDFKSKESITRATNKYPLSIEGFNNCMDELNSIYSKLLAETEWIVSDCNEGYPYPVKRNKN